MSLESVKNLILMKSLTNKIYDDLYAISWYVFR
jgi:hypothetical protein